MPTMEQDFCALKQTQPTDIGTRKAILEKVQEWKGMGENLFISLVGCFSDIESKEQTLSLVRESLEKRLKDFEERERKFDLFEEGKKGELMFREEKLDEQLKSVCEQIESLEVSQGKLDGLRNQECEKLKEIEKREREIEVIRGLLEKRLREVENREKEFDKLHIGKLRELELKEELLSKEKKQLIEEVKLVNKKLKEKQKLSCDLIERLELALNMLERMKVVVDERFKEIEAWEAVAHKSLTAKLNEAGLIRESLEKRFEEFGKIEEEFILFQEDRTRKLKSMEQQIGTLRIELLKDVKLREEQLKEEQKLGHQLSDCLQQMVSKKLKEIESQELTLNVACDALDAASPKDADLSRESANKLLQVSIACKDQKPECRMREVQLEGNTHDIHEVKQSGMTDALDAHFTIDPNKPVNLKHALQKDGTILEMLINRTDKDLELIDDEIFKVLLLSSDPAKFVLDAVEGLYKPNLGKGCKESKMMRVGILLLDQLTKMSPNIQPCVREAAIKLAFEWMSKLNTAAENPLEVLGLLHLLAAYNLSSYFDKNELFSFAKSVAQHKQTPELSRILGLAEKMPDLLKNLIHEKQYLLASTYIHECGLENMFPQAAVLNYYVKHSKLSAKAKCRREQKSSDAQDKAIVSEIADLRVAIEHIIKYGLESEYSLDILTERIKQLERNRASLRCRNSSSISDVQKQGKGKKPWDSNRRDVGQKQHEECRSSPPWKAQTCQSKSERHRDLVDEVPRTHTSSACKRRRKNLLFQTIRSPFEHQ